MKAPRKKTPPKSVADMLRPGTITAQWGDGPLLEFGRQPPPFTGETFWEACKTYFPPELHTPAAAYLLKLSSKAQRADAKKAGRGNPRVGIGQRVQNLMTWPLKMEQGMARQIVARQVCKCCDEDGFPAELCRCDSYGRVTTLHKQWRSDRRKGKQKDKP